MNRITGLERPELSTEEFVKECVKLLNADWDEIVGPSRRRETTYIRQLIVALGREWWGQQTNDLASILNRSPDRVSHIVGEGIKRRVDDEVFSSQVDRLDAELAQLVQGGVVNAHNDQ